MTDHSASPDLREAAKAVVIAYDNGVLGSVDDLRAALQASPAPEGLRAALYPHRGDWRHPKWCRWERGQDEPACDCGLDALRCSFAATPSEPEPPMSERDKFLWQRSVPAPPRPEAIAVAEQPEEVSPWLR